MSDVIQTILTRRSVRKFQEKAIPAEQLEQILKAAVYAPSARGLQTWQFTAITDRAKIQKLAKAVGAALGNDAYNFYEPEVLVLTSNDRGSPFAKEDNSTALENIFLAAWSLGIGSVWINQLQGTHDDPAVRALLTEFGVPQNHAVFGVAALGYPAATPPAEVQKKGVIKIVG